MNLTQLTAISPIDGRYREKISALDNYFSEFALIKYRVRVEIEYLLALCELPVTNTKKRSAEDKKQIQSVYQNFSIQDAEWIKEKEKETNHDVKAVEYFVKDKITALGQAEIKELVHFGLTSQDINNTAIPLSLKKAVDAEYLPLLENALSLLKEKEKEYENVAMLARTHGQPASPTRLGKEFHVFIERIEIQLAQLKAIPFNAKFGGATGNFNAHKVAYPAIDWKKFANDFISNFGLVRSQTTTQIEHYDNLAALFDCLKRINTILTDLSRDIWTYISFDYFKQKIKAGEVGSSAMPHKVNPIDFENAEGNLGMANAVFEHFSSKLPISRLQRDLTDSTVLRNIGVPLAHTFIALHSLSKGISKLLLNKEKIDADLENNWAVIAEAIQTILRREGYANPYETLKALTRKNEKITQKSFMDFIDNLKIKDAIKAEMKAITPFNYTGI